MNHPLVLTLSLLEQSHECYTLSVSVQNQSAVKLLLPVPELTDFCFKRNDNGSEAEWYTCLFISSGWAGLVLPPGESREFTYSAKTTLGESDLDGELRYRWRVAPLPGKHKLFVRFRVDSSYFDGDSHFSLPDMERRAASAEAVVWLGEVVSNELDVDHDPMRHTG